MQITVDIPDEIAAKMLGPGEPQRVLLELALNSALDADRISTSEAAETLGLDTRLEVDLVLCGLRQQIRAVAEEDVRRTMAGIDALSVPQERAQAA